MHKFTLPLLLISLIFPSFAAEVTASFNHPNDYYYPKEEYRTPWRCTFSEPMRITGAPVDQVPEGISIEPPIQGKWQWSSPSSLDFIPDSSWRTGFRYFMTIPKGIRSSVNGNTTTKQSIDTLQLGDFSAYLGSGTGNICSRVSPINLTFTLPVDTLEIRRTLKGLPLNYRIATNTFKPINRRFTISPPHELWGEGERFVVTIDSSLKPMEGNIPFRSPNAIVITATDSLKIVGFFRQNKMVSPNDSLFLEDRHAVLFNRTLLAKESEHYISVNGKPYQLTGNSDRLDVSSMVEPGVVCSLKILAGLKGSDGSFLFRDTSFVFVGDSGRIDPEVKPLTITGVRAHWSNDSSQLLSEKEPLTLRPNFTVSFEYPRFMESSEHNGFDLYRVQLITPSGVVTHDEQKPLLLQPNMLCTLVVPAGTYGASRQLKEEYRLPFRTGKGEYSSECEFYRRETLSRNYWRDPVQSYEAVFSQILPGNPSIPLKQYGSGSDVSLRKVSFEEIRRCVPDSLIAGSWITKKFVEPQSDSIGYRYIPLKLDTVLSDQGFGAVDAKIVTGGDTVRLRRTIVSDLGAEIRYGRDEFSVVATSILKRSPIKNAKVTLFDKSGTVFSEGFTDESGIFSGETSSNIKSIAVIAGEDSVNYPYTPFTYENIIHGTIKTDRTLYKPGDSLFFTGTIREMKTLLEPLPSQKAVVSIRWDGAPLWIDTVEITGNGFFADTVIIPSGVARREYPIYATLLSNNKVIQGKCSVQDFRPAELTSSIDFDTTTESEVKFTLRSQWLHGGSAGGSDYSWKGSFRPYYGQNLDRGFSWFENRSYENYSITGMGKKLSDDGTATITISRRKADEGGHYFVEGNVEGSPVQTASCDGGYQIPFSDRLRIGIPNSESYEMHDSSRITLKLCRENGINPPQTAVAVLVTKERIEKRWISNRCGLPAIAWDTLADTLWNNPIMSNDSGEVPFSLKKYQPGNYFFRAKCEQAEEERSFPFIVLDTTVQPETRDEEYYYHEEKPEIPFGTISMVDSTRTEYSVGDTVKIRVAAVQPCRFLFTESREKIFRNQWITLTGTDTILTVLITENGIPELELRALFLPPLSKTNNRLNEYQQKPWAQASMRIAVSSKPFLIPVKVAVAEKMYAPGDTAEVTISVPKVHRRAEATLSVVDEGLYLLKPDFLRLYESMYQSSNYGWVTGVRYFGNPLYGETPYDSLNGLNQFPLSQVRFGRSFGFGSGYGFGGGSGGVDDLMSLMGGGGGSSVSMKKSASASSRDLFANTARRTPERSTAIFVPRITFDSLGNAKVRVPLPGNLTKWRVSVSVDAVRSFGNDTCFFVTTIPLMVRPQLPKFLRVGDSASAAYLVENRSSRDRAIRSGSIVEGDTVASEFSLKPDEVRLCRFPLIGSKSGEREVVLGVQSETNADGIAVKIPVIAERIRETAAFGGSTIDSLSIPLIVPDSGTIDSGTLAITLSTTRMQNLAEGMKYLFDYPYGCLEQQGSRILPLLQLEDFAKRFDLEQLKNGDERLVIQKYLDQIPQFQHDSSGGLRYWPSKNGATYPWLTAFVLEIMNSAQQKGFTIDTICYDKAVRYLKRELREKPVTDRDFVLSAYAQQILAESGKANLIELRKLYRKRNSMPFSAKITLLKAFTAAKQPERKVRVLRHSITGELVESGRLAYFKFGESDWHEQFHESSVRQTALALEALLSSGAKSRYDEPMIRWLTEQRKSGRWRTTQENLAVFRAFNAYTKVYENDTPKLFAAVDLCDSRWFEDSLVGRSSQVNRSRELMSLHAKTDTVSVVAQGSGRLYTDLVISSYPSGMAQPKGTGFTIERKIYLKGDTIPVDPSHLIAGNMYRVELTVTNGQNLSFVAINDPIPAGCESINPDFRSADQREAVKNTRWESRSVLSHSEFRDERILLFADQLYAGTTNYSYLFKAVTPGNYFWPAVSVEAMYFPEMYGHGEERMVEITSPEK